MSWWHLTVGEKKKSTVLRHRTVIINNRTDADTTSTHPAPPASSHQWLSRLKTLGVGVLDQISFRSNNAQILRCSFQGVSISKRLW